MKINVTKGSQPRQLVRYLLASEKQRDSQAPEIETNMVGQTAAELAAEFRFAHTLNPRVKQTMAHYAISLPPGERVDPEQRQEINQRLLELTGHSDCPYVCAEHFDQIEKNDVQHWHVATSYVNLHGQHVEDDFIRVRLKGIEQQLEQEFQLEPTTDKQRQHHHIPTGEYRRKQRTGEILPREMLWDKIETHSADHPSLSTLTVRLKADAINVHFRPKGDLITGISYELQGFACSGSKLGKAFTFNGLQKQLGVTHDPQHDAELLQLQAMDTEQCRHWLDRQEQAEQQAQSPALKPLSLDELRDWYKQAKQLGRSPQHLQSIQQLGRSERAFTPKDALNHIDDSLAWLEAKRQAQPEAEQQQIELASQSVEQDSLPQPSVAVFDNWASKAQILGRDLQHLQTIQQIKRQERPYTAQDVQALFADNAAWDQAIDLGNQAHFILDVEGYHHARTGITAFKGRHYSLQKNENGDLLIEADSRGVIFEAEDHNLKQARLTPEDHDRFQQQYQKSWQRWQRQQELAQQQQAQKQKDLGWER